MEPGDQLLRGGVIDALGAVERPSRRDVRRRSCPKREKLREQR
jgi:hypothetical protein